jgi:hypothetical protein
MSEFIGLWSDCATSSGTFRLYMDCVQEMWSVHINDMSFHSHFTVMTVSLSGLSMVHGDATVGVTYC